MNFPGWGMVGIAALSAGALAQSGHMARLTSVEGYVQVSQAGGNASNPGVLNMPLVEGQTVATEDSGQAELEFEDGSLARITPDSTVVLLRLGGDSGTQIVLVKGLAYFELRAAPGIGYTIFAADDRLHPTANTTVRVELDAPPPAIAVLDGTLQVERPGSYTTEVRAGETFRADVNGEGRYFLLQGITPDTWDAWNETRDQQAADAVARQTDARSGYSGDKGYGWSDLDANGTWYDAGPQGQVWQPEGGDGPDFDPYANGNWVWYPVRGYVWASAYPWGWTPFHCGSWSYWGGFGWGWVPAGNCVSFGFGTSFDGPSGGGSFVNIGMAPRGYPVHRPPSPVRPGLHPIVPVRGTLLLQTSSPREAPRLINGVRATPLRGTAMGHTPRGGTAAGAALLRDFPVDRGTRTPILGLRPGEGRASVGGSEARRLPGAPSNTANSIIGSTDHLGGRTPDTSAIHSDSSVYDAVRFTPDGSPNVQRTPGKPDRMQLDVPQAAPSSAPTYRRAPSSNAQSSGSQRLQPAPGYTPRTIAPTAQSSRPMVSPPPPPAHAAAPAPAPAATPANRK